MKSDGLVDRVSARRKPVCGAPSQMFSLYGESFPCLFRQLWQIGDHVSRVLKNMSCLQLEGRKLSRELHNTFGKQSPCCL